MVPRGALVALLGLATLLPIAIVLVTGTSLLFAGLNDAVAARALNGVALGLGILWILSLIGLTMVLTIDALNRGDAPREDPTEEEG